MEMMKRKYRISRILYIAASVFFFVFQIVYGRFSHGVSSLYMTWAFLIPLVSGIINEVSYHVKATIRELNMRHLLAGGAVWLTLGSVFQGVLDIYGTTNQLTIMFLIVGMAQTAGAITIFVSAFYNSSKWWEGK